MKKRYLVILILFIVIGISCFLINIKLKEGKTMNEIKIIINDISFDCILENNKTTRSLVEEVPFTILMKDLNNNEKYYYFSKSFVTDASVPKEINKGDIMLYGSDCLVIFYESFKTNYSYTKIGTIKDTTKLKEALQGESVKVSFLKK